MRVRRMMGVALIAGWSAISPSRVVGADAVDGARRRHVASELATYNVPSQPDRHVGLHPPTVAGDSQSKIDNRESKIHVTVVLVIGAPGEPKYGRGFEAEVDGWEKAARAANGRVIAIGTDAAKSADVTDRDQLAAALAAEPKTGTAELWVVLIGHGTFDGKDAKFNLRGPDFSAAELADWLKPFQRPLAVIDTSSASAPFLSALSAPGRVIVTATRSGFEQNYARFGEFLAATITDPAADLDRDGQVSLLEAFLLAARRTAEFYKTEGRLATEHPLLDDNGDGLGTPADWFKGMRATKRARDGAELDGLRARQLCFVRNATEQALPPELRARRDNLERQVEQLRGAKPTLPESEYFARLEKLMLELAAIYDGT